MHGETRQTDGVAAFANLGPKENGVKPGMTEKPRIRPERVVQGFCRTPLFCGPKGHEKSWHWQPGGSDTDFNTGRVRALFGY